MKKKRLFSYDFVRCFATLTVVWLHFRIHTLIPEFAYTDFSDTNFGRQIVTVFFIISGVMSARSAMREDESVPFGKRVLEYYKKRWWAIFPAFYAAYLLAMVISHGGPTIILTPRILFTVFGIDGYVEEYGIVTSYLVGEWFLGLLILLYVLTPFLVRLVRKYPVPSGIVFTLAYVAVVLFLPLPRTKETSILVRGFDYIIGLYIGSYVKKVDWRFAVPGVLALPFLFITGFPGPGSFIDTLLGTATYFLLLYIGMLIGGEAGIGQKKLPEVGAEGAGTDPVPGGQAPAPVRSGFRIPDPRLLVLFIAERSYEIYLMHHVVIRRYSMDLSGASWLNRAAWLVFVFILVLAYATVLHGFIKYLAANRRKR